MIPAEQTLGTFITDTQLVVQSWDDWLTRVTGIPAAAAYRRPLTDLVPDLELRGLRARFDRVLSDGVVEVLAPAFHQYLFPCPPQTPTHHFRLMQQRITITPLREDDRIVGTMVSVEDVTARREYERDLADQLNSNDESVRLHAAQALAAEADSAPTLARALQDSSWRVRKTAVTGLAEHGDEELIASLIQALHLEHRNLSTLNSTLQVIGLTQADATQMLVKLLHSEDVDLRIYIALVLGDRSDQAAIPHLLALLEDPDVNLRYHAIEALGKLNADEAVPRLSEIILGDNSFLAFAALDALARIGDAVPPRILLPLFDDPFLAQPTVDLLGRSGTLAAVKPLTQALDKAHIPPIAIARALVALFDREQQTYGTGSLVAAEIYRTLSPHGARRLLDAVESGDEQEARSLVQVLSWLNDPEITLALARQIGRPGLADIVVEALVRTGAAGMDQLIAQLDSDNDTVVIASANVLRRIGARQAVPALTNLLQRDGEVAVVAARALAQIGDMQPFETLLGLLDHPDAAIRQAAVGALNAIGHPNMAERLVPLLEDPNPYLRESAAQIAGYFGYPSCVPALLARCQDPDERVRRAAVAQLPFVDDPRALPALAEALRIGKPSVRVAAARALAHLAVGQATPLSMSTLSDADPWIRYYGAQALGRLRVLESSDALLQLVHNDPATPVRLAALESLGLIAASESVKYIVPLVGESHLEIALAAIKCLGAIGGPEARSALVVALQAREPERRVAALEALARCGNGQLVALLYRVAHDEQNHDVRIAAVAALGALKTAESVAALIQLSAYPLLRPATVVALASAGEAWIDAVAAGLKDTQVGVRRAVVETLARMQHPTATSHLRSALDDADPQVQTAADAAIQRLVRL